MPCAKIALEDPRQINGDAQGLAVRTMALSAYKLDSQYPHSVSMLISFQITWTDIKPVLV
jgi:hypothetical protein